MSLLLLLGGEAEEEAVAPSSRVVINREHPPSKIAVLIKAEDGTKLGRWAEDEAKVENVLAEFTKAGEMPGGHTESGCSLARDPKQSYPDLGLFSRYEVQGAGGEKLWEGGLRQQPQSDGDRISISPKAVGDRQFLEDDEGAVIGFIHQELGAWTGASAQRKINNGSGVDQTSSPSVATGGDPYISITSAGPISKPVWFTMFDAGSGVRIGRVVGGIEPVNLQTTAKDPNVFTSFYAADDGDLANATELSSDLSAEGPFEIDVASRQVVAFQGFYNGVEAGEAGKEYGYRLGHLVVLSDTLINAGLPVLGQWPNIGYTAAEMLPYIADLAGLHMKSELLEDDGFIIPHAWFSDPGTPMSKLVEVTKYGLLDWFVFNDRILQYRFPGTYGRKWRLGAGSSPKNSGPDASRVWSELRVTWQDVDGTTKTALVPAITDERNAAVAAGRPRRKLLALNGVCTEALALRTGTRFLEEANRLDQSGSVDITGHCMDQYGVWWPAAYVQPGDEVADPGTQNYRKVTSVNYSHDSKTASCTIGAPPEGMSAIEARFGAKLIELGLG